MALKFLEEVRMGIRSASLKKDIICYYINNGDNTLADLGKELNLSVPTVTKLVGELIDDGFELPKVHYDTVVNQFTYQLGNCRYAEIELLTEVGKGVITVIDIITDNVFLKRGTADAHSYFF